MVLSPYLPLAHISLCVMKWTIDNFLLPLAVYILMTRPTEKRCAGLHGDYTISPPPNIFVSPFNPLLPSFLSSSSSPPTIHAHILLFRTDPTQSLVTWEENKPPSWTAVFPIQPVNHRRNKVKGVVFYYTQRTEPVTYSPSLRVR